MVPHKATKRETEETEEEEEGREKRVGFSTQTDTERFRTASIVFQRMRARALTRLGVGRLPFTLNVCSF